MPNHVNQVSGFVLQLQPTVCAAGACAHNWGGVFLAKENSVGWVPLLCGLVIGFALWGISKHQRARRAAEERAEQEKQEKQEKPAWMRAMRAAENNINSISFNGQQQSGG